RAKPWPQQDCPAMVLTQLDLISAASEKGADSGRALALRPRWPPRTTTRQPSTPPTVAGWGGHRLGDLDVPPPSRLVAPGHHTRHAQPPARPRLRHRKRQYGRYLPAVASFHVQLRQQKTSRLRR